MGRHDVKRQIASNEYQTKLVNDSNEKIAREANEFKERMWHEQNAYNSPEEQKKRYAAAGLNPNLMMEAHGDSGQAGDFGDPATYEAKANITDPSVWSQQSQARTAKLNAISDQIQKLGPTIDGMIGAYYRPQDYQSQFNLRDSQANLNNTNAHWIPTNSSSQNVLNNLLGDYYTELKHGQQYDNIYKQAKALNAPDYVASELAEKFASAQELYASALLKGKEAHWYDRYMQKQINLLISQDKGLKQNQKFFSETWEDNKNTIHANYEQAKATAEHLKKYQNCPKDIYENIWNLYANGQDLSKEGFEAFKSFVDQQIAQKNIAETDEGFRWWRDLWEGANEVIPWVIIGILSRGKGPKPPTTPGAPKPIFDPTPSPMSPQQIRTIQKNSTYYPKDPSKFGRQH